jgi:hypothetical protein
MGLIFTTIFRKFSPRVMGRRRSQKAIEAEAKVKDALCKVKSGKIKTGYAAAKRLDVSKSKNIADCGGESRVLKLVKNKNYCRSRVKRH